MLIRRNGNQLKLRLFCIFLRKRFPFIYLCLEYFLYCSSWLDFCNFFQGNKLALLIEFRTLGTIIQSFLLLYHSFCFPEGWGIFPCRHRGNAEPGDKPDFYWKTGQLDRTKTLILDCFLSLQNISSSKRNRMPISSFFLWVATVRWFL